MHSYPVPNNLLPHNVDTQLQKRFAKNRSQPGLWQMENDKKETTENRDIAKGKSSTKNKA